MRPIPQEYYDDNRELYDAQTSQAPNELRKCPHLVLQRINAMEVKCRNCGVGWLFTSVIPRDILDRIK